MLQNKFVDPDEENSIEIVKNYLSERVDKERSWEYIQDVSTCCYCAEKDSNLDAKVICRYCCYESFQMVLDDDPDFFSIGNLASYSSYGIIDEPGRYKPDIVAPGIFIFSCW